MTTKLQHTKCVKPKVWGVYAHRLTSR